MNRLKSRKDFRQLTLFDTTNLYPEDRVLEWLNEPVALIHIRHHGHLTKVDTFRNGEKYIWVEKTWIIDKLATFGYQKTHNLTTSNQTFEVFRPIKKNKKRTE